MELPPWLSQIFTQSGSRKVVRNRTARAWTFQARVLTILRAVRAVSRPRWGSVGQFWVTLVKAGPG